MPNTGWIPDFRDTRDWTAEHPKVNPLLDKMGFYDREKEVLPSSVDLREHFSPVQNQDPLNSCTVHTAVGLLGYFQNKAFNRSIPGSRLFLYKASRNLIGMIGDKGGYLRTTMQGMRVFGTPPETYWPYHPALVDVEPPPFCYALAANYKAISYYRIVSPGITNKQLLTRVKALLTMKLPIMFGLALYSSIYNSFLSGGIPYPLPGEPQVGLHALVAVGYDDTQRIRNVNFLTGQGLETVGALRIRNSWGPQWGNSGYGWLSYDYLLNGLTSDWWSLIDSDFVDTGEFGF